LGVDAIVVVGGMVADDLCERAARTNATTPRDAPRTTGRT
jgi:hypothetical protein